jgi:hypothetical protein
VPDKNGVSDCDALAFRKHVKCAQLYAFEILAVEGEDYRRMTLALCKSKFARLLAPPVDGIFIAEYKQGDIGDVLFRVVCNMGLL